MACVRFLSSDNTHLCDVGVHVGTTLAECVKLSGMLHRECRKYGTTTAINSSDERVFADCLITVVLNTVRVQVYTEATGTRCFIPVLRDSNFSDVASVVNNFYTHIGEEVLPIYNRKSKQLVCTSRTSHGYGKILDYAFPIVFRVVPARAVRPMRCT